MTRRIDVIIGAYGVSVHSMIIDKAMAEESAQEQVGQRLNPVLFPEQDHYRVVAYRLESERTDANKGLVIAECEPLQGSTNAIHGC